jgi:glycerol kinase
MAVQSAKRGEIIVRTDNIHAIQHVADMIVAGNIGHTEERTAIGIADLAKLAHESWDSFHATFQAWQAPAMLLHFQ